jgi:hypothetical protein
MRTNAMAEMSAAIRTTIQKYGATIKDIPDDVLQDLSNMVSAYALDLRAEVERREREDETHKRATG